MMGGEGSEGLAAAHRWLGYRYLSGGYGRGFGVMGRGMMRYWGMMSNPDVPFGSIPYNSPEEIVKRRYAQGKICREEYFLMLEDLKETE